MCSSNAARCFSSVAAEMFRASGVIDRKILQGMPRWIADRRGAFSDWNFISSMGAVIRWVRCLRSVGPEVKSSTTLGPIAHQPRLAPSSSSSSSVMAATMSTRRATRPLGSGRPAFIRGSSLASQACASASYSGVAPVAMISATTSSSSSPSIAVTSLRVRALMAVSHTQHHRLGQRAQPLGQ